jgi:hypothetical protein
MVDEHVRRLQALLDKKGEMKGAESSFVAELWSSHNMDWLKVVLNVVRASQAQA